MNIYHLNICLADGIKVGVWELANALRFIDGQAERFNDGWNKERLIARLLKESTS